MDGAHSAFLSTLMPQIETEVACVADAYVRPSWAAVTLVHTHIARFVIYSNRAAAYPDARLVRLRAAAAAQLEGSVSFHAAWRTALVEVRKAADAALREAAPRDAHLHGTCLLMGVDPASGAVYFRKIEPRCPRGVVAPPPANFHAYATMYPSEGLCEVHERPVTTVADSVYEPPFVAVVLDQRIAAADTRRLQAFMTSRDYVELYPTVAAGAVPRDVDAATCSANEGDACGVRRRSPEVMRPDGSPLSSPPFSASPRGGARAVQHRGPDLVVEHVTHASERVGALLRHTPDVALFACAWSLAQ